MRGQHQKGAIAVEFALILPVIVMLLFGILEFSLLLFNKQILTNASREGARFGIIDNTLDDQIEGVVRAYCEDNLVTFGSGTIGEFQPMRDIPEGYVTVTVNYLYDFLFFTNFETITLSATTVMRLEQVPE